MPPAKKQKTIAPAQGSGSLLAMFKAAGAKSKEAGVADTEVVKLRAAVLPESSCKDTPAVRADAKTPATTTTEPARTTTTAAPVSNVHSAIDLAKAANWIELYALLDSDKEIVNARPEMREYGVLHQAAFHGVAEAIDILIDKYGADPKILTKSGASIMDVAKEQGHDSLLKHLASRMSPSIIDALPPAKKLKASSVPSTPGSVAAMFKPASSSAPKSSGSSGVKAKSSGSALSSELVNSEAVIKKAKPSGSSSSSEPMTSEAVIKKAHAAIDLAKAGNWEELFATLDNHEDLVNVRPEVREYGILHQVAFHGDESVLNTLIEKYGADVKMQSKFGETAVDIAKHNGHHQVAESLVSRCSPKMFTRFDTLTPEKESKKVSGGPMPIPPFTDALLKDAHGLIDLAKEAQWAQLYKLLDTRPELVNVRPEAREYGALHQAVYHGDEDAVKTLIRKYGADPDLRTRSGNTTTFIATMQGHAQIAMSLEGKDSGADAPESGKDEDFDFKQMADGSWKVVAVTK